MKIPTTFEEAVQAWREAAHEYNEQAVLYKLEWGKAVSESDGANAPARTADADAATKELSQARDYANIEMQALYHCMIHLRGDQALEAA